MCFVIGDSGGPVDPKTFQKWVWKFIINISTTWYDDEAPEFFICPNSATMQEENLAMVGRVSKRHKTINGWLNFWGILGQVYRHKVEDHGCDRNYHPAFSCEWSAIIYSRYYVFAQDMIKVDN